MSSKSFGKDLDTYIKEKFGDVAAFVDAVHNSFTTNLTEEMINKSIEKDGLFDECTIYHLHVIAETLNLDDRALMDGRIENKKPPIYYLEKFDPGGKGTDAERALKLAAHAVISYGRACEIMWCSKWDYPEIESTGCNCVGCKSMLMYVKERRFGHGKT